MSKIIISTFFFIAILSAFNISKAQKNTLVIIGSVHKPIKFIRDTSYLNALKRVKPDIVLLESDSSIFDNCNFKNPPNAKKIKLATGEIPIYLLNSAYPEYKSAFIYKFLFNNKACLLPYDSYIPDRKKLVAAYYKEELSFWNTIDSLSNNWKDAGEKQLMIDLTNLIKFRKTIADLYTLNSPANTDSTRKYNLLLEKLRPVVSKHEELKKFEEHYFKRLDFILNDRNKKFCNNIQSILSTNKNKTIVVITGVNHKAFLLDHFSKKTNISVREYFDY